jgi:hypothetical protein
MVRLAILGRHHRRRSGSLGPHPHVHPEEEAQGQTDEPDDLGEGAESIATAMSRSLLSATFRTGTVKCPRKEVAMRSMPSTVFGLALICLALSGCDSAGTETVRTSNYLDGSLRREEFLIDDVPVAETWHHPNGTELLSSEFSQSPDEIGHSFYFDDEGRLTLYFPNRDGRAHGRGIRFHIPVEEYTIVVYEDGAAVEEIIVTPGDPQFEEPSD